MFTYGKLNEENKIAELVQSELRITDTYHVFLSAEVDFDGANYIGRQWDRPVIKDTLEYDKEQAILAVNVKTAEDIVALVGDAEDQRNKTAKSVQLLYIQANGTITDEELVELTALNTMFSTIEQMIADGKTKIATIEACTTVEELEVV